MPGTTGGNATATFSVNGDVEVNTDSGIVQRYGLAAVRGLCGL